MEESLVLLSSLSPKISPKSRKQKKKAHTKLALKKQIRRSSIFDKLPENSPANVVECNSSESLPSSSSSSGVVDKSSSVIVISDTSSESDKVSAKVEIQNARRKKSSIIEKKIKNDAIQNWICSVNAATNEVCTDESVFSELSTIYGENDLKRNICEGEKKTAYNSTFVSDVESPNFDQKFRKLISKYTSIKEESESDKSSSDKSVIEDSFCDDKAEDDVGKQNGKEKDLENCEKVDECGKKKQNLENSFDGVEANNDDHIIKTLDDLYGKRWRENKDSVLINSEPRKPKKDINTPSTKTEIKPNLACSNPYVDSETKKSNNLLRILQTKRIEAALESPWWHNLKDLCDSDSNSEDSNKEHESVHRRLNFDDDLEESDKENDVDKNNKSKLDKEKEVEKNNNKKSDKENVGDKTSKKLNNVAKDLAAVKTANKLLKMFDDLKIKSDSWDKNNLNNNKISKTDVKPKKTAKKTKETNKLPLEDDPKPKRATKNKQVKGVNLDVDPNSEKSMKISNSNYLKKKTVTQSFLASLSANVPIEQSHPSALIYRNNFKQHRDKLTQKLFKLYNTTIFDNCIPEDTQLEWNTRMRGSAGLCHCRKATKAGEEVRRSVKISLSTKVLDSADRLRDTLVHEMCHAATWLVNKISDGHGQYWKAWANKAMAAYPELPPITRCHDYNISTKYTYRCTYCGYSFGRHTKSLNLETKRCGHCYSRFEVLVNKKDKTGNVVQVPCTPKKEANGFALFVKENYANYKSPQLNHGDVMKVLGQKFAEIKFGKEQG